MLHSGLETVYDSLIEEVQWRPPDQPRNVFCRCVAIPSLVIGTYVSGYEAVRQLFVSDYSFNTVPEVISGYLHLPCLSS